MADKTNEQKVDELAARLMYLGCNPKHARYKADRIVNYDEHFRNEHLTREDIIGALIPDTPPLTRESIAAGLIERGASREVAEAVAAHKLPGREVAP